MARDRNAKPAGDDAPIDFEAAMNELERIVEELEGSQLTLDQSLAHYERGMVLASQLTKTLDEAEKRIEKLVEGGAGETPRTEPLADERPAAAPSEPPRHVEELPQRTHDEPSRRAAEEALRRASSEGELPF